MTPSKGGKVARGFRWKLTVGCLRFGPVPHRPNKMTRMRHGRLLKELLKGQSIHHVFLDPSVRAIDALLEP